MDIKELFKNKMNSLSEDITLTRGNNTYSYNNIEAALSSKRNNDKIAYEDKDLQDESSFYKKKIDEAIKKGDNDTANFYKEKQSEVVGQIHKNHGDIGRRAYISKEGDDPAVYEELKKQDGYKDAAGEHHKDLANHFEGKSDDYFNKAVEAAKRGDQELKDFYLEKGNHYLGLTNMHKDRHFEATGNQLETNGDIKYKEYKAKKEAETQKAQEQQPEPAKAEAPKTNNVESTPDATTKTANSTNEPSALDQAKSQTKAPTEFKKAETANDKQPEQINTETKITKDNEPSVLKGAKEYDGKNPVEAPKPETKTVEAKPQEVSNMPKDNSHLTGGTKQLDQSNYLNKPQLGTKAETTNKVEPTKTEVPKQQASNSEELAKNAKQAEPVKAEAPKQEVAPKVAEPNHPNIQKPVDAQPAPASAPQPAPAPVNPHPSAPGTVAQPIQPTPVVAPNHPNIQKPVDAQPAPASAPQPAPVNPHPSAPGTVAAPQPAINNMPKDNSHLTGGTTQLDQSNPLNHSQIGSGNVMNTGITTNQPSIIPSSGHVVNNAPQSNPVDHWANFKQSSHDAYGHFKNFAGQQYHNIKQNLGQHYQSMKQNAHEHLANAKQFASDHAHEIAGAGALGAAGLAAYAAYKHFKNKKKQPAPQQHH